MKKYPELDLRISAFVELGKVMGKAAESITSAHTDFEVQYPDFFQSLQYASQLNPWFTLTNIALAFNAWHELLTFDLISAWIKEYEPGLQNLESKRVAVILAGNIPIVGFHDFLCVLISGHSFIGKLSSGDKILMPALAAVLCKIEPSFEQLINFSESTIKDFDLIIATGSNNSARYFEHYFSKYPHIIRKNRNSIAVLSGDESDETLKKLGQDICSYFGLGCRNVSKIFIPIGYAPEKLFIAIEPYKQILNDHYKYMNNYSYQRSIYLLNTIKHLDNDVFILTESAKYSSPIPVLYYEFYNDLEGLKLKIANDDELIQCIATDAFSSAKTVDPGCTQTPGLCDYADGIDTVAFLLSQ